MSTTVLFVGVVVLAFVAGRFLERFAAKAFALAGVEYLLLGVLLGPILDVLSPEVMKQLDLFVSTVLGVIGFLVGLEVRQIRTTMDSLLAGLGASAGVVLAIAAATTGLIQVLDPSLLHVSDPLVADPLTATDDALVSVWISPEALWIGLTVGAAAGTSSTVLVETALRRFDVSPERASLLRSMTSAAQVLAIFAFGLAMAGSRATATAGALGLTIVEWATITILSGVFMGVLFSVFLGREDDPMRLSVAAVGVIVFSAGVGAALGVSPLFANLFAGLTLALTSPHASRLDESLRPLRFPTTVMVLLLAGATLVPTTGWYWVLVPSYVVLRTAARLVFSRLAVSTFVGDDTAANGVGRAVLGQGVLASAISLAFAQRFPDLAGPVTSTIVGGVLITDLFALRALRRYLADIGEIKALAPVAAPVVAAPTPPHGFHVEPGEPDEHGEHGEHGEHEAPEPHGKPEPEPLGTSAITEGDA